MASRKTVSIGKLTRKLSMVTEEDCAGGYRLGHAGQEDGRDWSPLQS